MGDLFPGCEFFSILYFFVDLMDDIRYREGSEKRAAAKVNKWLPDKEGEQLQIPYIIAPGSYKEQIEKAIATMNKILHCHKQAWVPRDPSKHKHYIRFIKEDGYGNILLKKKKDK